MVRQTEGIRRADAGSTDIEGFIAPDVGIVEHALYFTTAPDALAKTIQLLDVDRLDIPGATLVWDETIGRRTGTKAFSGSWWAANGALTMTFVVPLVQLEAVADTEAEVIEITGSAVTLSIAECAPAGELIREGRNLELNGKTPWAAAVCRTQ